MCLSDSYLIPFHCFSRASGDKNLTPEVRSMLAQQVVPHLLWREAFFQATGETPSNNAVLLSSLAKAPDISHDALSGTAAEESNTKTAQVEGKKSKDDKKTDRNNRSGKNGKKAKGVNEDDGGKLSDGTSGKASKKKILKPATGARNEGPRRSKKGNGRKTIKRRRQALGGEEGL